jgi:hypothetical protein
MGFEKDRAELAVKKSGGCTFILTLPPMGHLDGARGLTL